ncbi:coiled-coil domain-containing protein [Enterococcus wangshanyuanii]|uniref:Serine protease n=1 Tax=Enterococcus wangshanyuanii TaxID=2005703 RepID=A0ABQ1NUD3_9ENTE|nr:CAP domain-containing protein [Enterococcus wangshanyuanii]GGC84906.1 serine protease [Enterococcus wangshanyuanii]
MKKKSLTLLIVGMMTATGALAPISAMAETADKKIEQQDKEISALKEKQKSVTTQITTLEEEISSIYDKGIELNRQKTSLTEESEQLKKDIKALDVRINKRTEAIQNQGRNVQVNGQGTQILDMILNSESISDAVGRVQAISSILTANNDLVKQQKEDKKLVETKKADIQTNLDAVEEATKQLEKEKESLVSKQADLNVLKAEVDSETAGAENSKNELVKKQQEALKAQLAAEEKQAENKKAAAKQEKTTTQTTTANEESTAPSTSEEVAAPESNSSEQTNTTPSESNSTDQGNTTPSEGPKDPTPTPPVTSADATFQALNALRTANGLNPVSWDAGLAASAGARASMMQDYQIPSDHWNRGDEVIAFMFAPGNSVIMAWYNETNMVSPSGTGHRDWEMNPSMTRVGFGYAGDVIVGHSA